MTNPLLECIELEPEGGRKASASVIWLHGLGADGSDFVPVVPLLGLGDAAVRFVFPHAPRIPVTVNGGMVMPAWYDVSGPDLRRQVDIEGIQRSSTQIAALIDRERERGIPASRLVLAGFSQGGAIALHHGLRHPEPLAGIIALSTYLAVELADGDEPPPAIRQVPVFQAHGTQDPVVLFERGQAARDRLRELGFGVEWHEYPMGHEVCMEEIEAIGKWVRVRT